MVVPVKLSRLIHAMKVHVQPGLIGRAGMNALKNVTVVFNRALASVKMDRKVIVQGQQPMNNNAIDNLLEQQPMNNNAIEMVYWNNRISGTASNSWT